MLLGYLAAIFIGLALGLMGGGGSILTVPVLVYLFALSASTATFYSLFIVGLVSLVGSLSYLRRNEVDFPKVLLFGLPSVLAVFLARRLLLPAFPDEILSVGNWHLSKDLMLLLLFAILMILASISMIKGRKVKEKPSSFLTSYPSIFIQGILIGAITALVGAGGGFLIIPVLVNILKVPMKKAVGTSLMIIAINSLLGFSFSLSFFDTDWTLVLIITAIAIIGIFLGSYLSTKISGKKLKPAFGWFVLVMGIYIIGKELLGKGMLG